MDELTASNGPSVWAPRNTKLSSPHIIYEFPFT